MIFGIVGKKEPVYILAAKGFFPNRGAYKLEMHPRFVLKIDRGINISNVSFIAFCSLRMDSYDFGDALKHMVSFSHNLVLFVFCRSLVTLPA